jgi:hypothetical protein
MEPVSSVFTSSFVVMVVSRSLAEITAIPGPNSKRKLSRMGRVLLLLSTPLKDDKWRNNWLLDTIKCMDFICTSKMPQQLASRELDPWNIFPHLMNYFQPLFNKRS